MFNTLSAEIQCWNIICACLLCAVCLTGFLTVYSATAFAIVCGGVNYYLHKREENLRHRLSILGLIKHDKRERRRRSEYDCPRRAVCANSATPSSLATPSRFGSVSFDYPRVSPGNTFDTTTRSHWSGEFDGSACGLASPVSMSKSSVLNRSCQSTSTPAHGRKSQLDWLPVTARRHPIQQEKYSVGSYPVVCLNKSPLPLAKPFASPSLIPAVKVKILPLTTSHVQNQTFGHPATSPEADKQDPCSTESVIQALKERRKRAYQDGLDSTGLSPTQAQQSSKRSRRESLCLPQMPPFTPVVTSVGGFGPPFLGSPSKNAVVRGPAPSPMVSTPEATFKRGRLCSTSSPPTSAKRHRNNAIVISYCSSKGILQQARNSQSQKRKGVPPDSSPLSKQTKKDHRTPQSDEEASTEKIEDSSKENDVPSESEPSKESESDSVDASKPRSRVKAPDWSTIEKKKLVYPEHIATLKEHENDQARDKQRLNRLLGGLQDVADQTSAEKVPVTTQANVAKPPSTLENTAGLPTFGIPPGASTSATSVQGLTTNTVSVISSPVMSVPSTVASPSKAAEEKAPPAIVSAPVTTTDTTVTPAVSSSSTAIAAPKPQFGAGFFSSRPTSTATTTVSETAAQVAPVSLPAAAASTAANPLLAALARFTSPKATEATTATSPSATTSQSSPTQTTSAAVSLPLPQTSALSVSTSAASASVTAPASDAAKPAAGGFIFSGPSLGGNKPISNTPSATLASPCFGTAAASTLPMFKAVTNATGTSATSSAPVPFQFGSSTQAAKSTTSEGFLVTAPSPTEPFKFGSSGGPAASATVATTTQATSPSSGLFKFGTSAPTGLQASQASAPLLQSPTSALSGSGTSMFTFGAGATPKATTTSAVPVFGSATVQAPATTLTGISTQPASGGFTFGAGAATAGSTTATTQAGFSFGASSAAAAPSGSSAAFKFGAQGQQPATAAATLSTPTTAASLFSGAPFTFGTPVQKQDTAPTAPQPFSFGTANTTQAATNSTPFVFGANSSGTGAASPFAFGATATTTAPSAAPFSFGTGTTSTPAFPQSSVTSPLFPSAAPVGQPSSAAQPGGFQFGAAQVQSAFGSATNGLTNGISSSASAPAAQPSVAAPGLFKFGATNNSSAPAFNFGASQCASNTTPKPAFNFGAPPAATGNLFSIGTASSHSERPIARPRSKRITKK